MRKFLGRFRKQPREVLTYSVDYSDWLATGETVLTATIEHSPATTPDLEQSNTFVLGGDVVEFKLGGGLSGTDYQLTILITTSDDQTVEREFNITVEEL